MSPKTRLSLLIVALVATVVLVLSTLYLYGLTEAKFRDIQEIAQTTADQVRTYLLQRIRLYSSEQPSLDLDTSKQIWRERVRTDQDLAEYLVGAFANTGSVAEILITDDNSIALAGTNTARLGERVRALTELSEWSNQSTATKLWRVLWGSQDLEMRVPLGFEVGDPRPVFTIRVLLAPALLRDAVVPQLMSLGAISLICVVVSAVIAGLLSNLAARPLTEVAQMIDSIAKGGSTESPPEPADSEMAALQSKLSLLGARIRGVADASALLERLEDAVLLFDRNDRLLVATIAAERWLGQNRWELLGRPIDEVFDAKTPLGALVRSSAALRTTLRNRPVRTPRPDGGEMDVLVSVEVMEEFSNRQRLGTIVTLRDAESRQELGSHLDDSFRREAMGRILRGVAHEIKNPLNSIQTHAQLLSMDVDDPELKKEVDIISREIRILDRMVVTLLDFTRPLELKLEEIDLVTLAGEIQQLVRPEAAHRGVNVEIEGEEGASVIQGDHALLRQAVVNVVMNAVEAIEGKGRVRIRIYPDDDAHVLAVSDEGPGIPEEIQEKIFNLYFTTKGRGNGIGLAMSYRVAQLHGATLDFTTEAGKGTEFRFRFPKPQPTLPT